MTKFIVILLSAVFVNNYVLSRFLGICPFLGVSKKLDSATGMSLAVIFVMLMATIREVFGNGTFLGFEIPVLIDNKISILTMAPGGFFVFGLLIALVNKFGKHKPKKKEFGCAGCPQAAACGRADCGGCAGQTEAEVSA